jgi:DNA modification methylase
MFPEEIPRRLIKMYSYIDDIVLDPFLGSGTTAKISLELERNFIGYEINSAYIPIIQNKISKSLFIHNNKIEIIHREPWSTKLYKTVHI